MSEREINGNRRNDRNRFAVQQGRLVAPLFDGIEGGSVEPNKVKKCKLTKKQVREIAELELMVMIDYGVEAAARSIAVLKEKPEASVRMPDFFR